MTKKSIPSNFKIRFVSGDYMDYKHDKVDLIVGNPPFTKISGSYRMHLLRNNHNKTLLILQNLFWKKQFQAQDMCL